VREPPMIKESPGNHNRKMVKKVKKPFTVIFLAREDLKIPVLRKIPADKKITIKRCMKSVILLRDFSKHSN